MAHNGSAYDTQFIYKFAHEFFGARKVKVLLPMNRMIELNIQIRTGFRMSLIFFKDSYKFMNLPLRLFPKSFGFHNELQKGFFPQLLNTRVNMNYSSNCLPDMPYFEIEQMNKEEKNRFLDWYEIENDRLKNSNEIYDLHEKMKKYCCNDCYVLSTAFSRFNKSMINKLKKPNVSVNHQFIILADFVT